MSIRKIDHLVLPVVSLARTRERLSALGFTVALEGHHPFGTANACVFFDDGTYLEPLALADRRKAGLAAKRGNVFTERDLAFRGRRNREGLSAIVVASEDAAGDHARYLAAGISAGEPLEFARPIMSPEGDVAEGRFRLAFAGGEASPDFFVFSCQRVVSFPQDMGDLRAHSNAVNGIKEVILVEETSLQPISLLTETVGASPEIGEHGSVFAAENANIRVVNGDQLKHEFGVSVGAGAAGLSGQAIIFRSADLAVTEIILAANDVAFIRRDGRVLVQPASGQGIVFGFEE